MNWRLFIALAPAVVMLAFVVWMVLKLRAIHRRHRRRMQTLKNWDDAIESLSTAPDKRTLDARAQRCAEIAEHMERDLKEE